MHHGLNRRFAVAFKGNKAMKRSVHENVIFPPRQSLDLGSHVPRPSQPSPQPDFQCSQVVSNTGCGLTSAEEPGPVLGGVEDAQYPDPFRLDSVKNQVIVVARNRPKAHADFLFTA